MTTASPPAARAKPRVSIITPVYQGAAHIKRCVENVADQHCASVEHIVIDGGSADRTPQILTELTARHHHLRWLSEPDQGQSDAMNKGHRIAHGDIIGVLNADDYYEPGVFHEVIRRFAEAPDIDMFVAACNVRDPSRRVAYINRPRLTSIGAVLAGFPFPVNPSAYFYRAHVHERVGGYDVSDHYTMDIDFLFKTFQTCRVRYVDEIWGNFVTWPDAKTSRDKAAGHAAARVRALHRRYLAALPVTRRARVLLARPFIVSARKLFNTLRMPGATFNRYRAKLLRQ